MTRVVGRVVRPKLNYDSFVDLTSVPVAQGGFAADGITFDGDLTGEEYAAIYDRMTSRDDDDAAKRADLRTDRDALDPADPLRRLYDYMLGE